MTTSITTRLSHSYRINSLHSNDSPLVEILDIIHTEPIMTTLTPAYSPVFPVLFIALAIAILSGISSSFAVPSSIVTELTVDVWLLGKVTLL